MKPNMFPNGTEKGGGGGLQDNATKPMLLMVANVCNLQLYIVL